MESFYMYHSHGQQALSPDLTLLLIQQLKEGIYIFSPDGRIILANDAAESLLGWAQTEIHEKTLEDFMTCCDTHPWTLPFEVRQGKAVLDGEASIRKKSGQLVWIGYTLTPIEQTGNIMALALTFRDITDKKQREKEIEKSEKLFHSLADSAIPLLWLINTQGELIYLNNSCLDFAGVSLDEAMTRTGGSIEAFAKTAFDGLIHSDDAAEATKNFKEALESRTSLVFEARHLRSDGQYRWFLLSTSPVIAKDGEFLGLVGSDVDIHDRKMAEEALARYAQRLEQSNKELEHFATIASHDLQEPLRKIRMFSDHLSEITPGLNAEGLDDLQRIQRAATRMQRLIGDLLDLSKITRRGKPFQKIEISQVLKEVLAELSYAYANIHERVESSGDSVIEADPNQLHQMLTQLLDNALKFHAPSKPSSVKITTQGDKDGQCRITVTDNGIGLKAEHLSRIFDTFVRLHGAEYAGTGIGLTLVKKIAERHHGSITVDSMPGTGSTFTVTLPIIQEQQV